MNREERLERMPPQSVETEQAVLGACLISARAIDDVALVLDGSEWYHAPHRLLWDAITKLHGEGSPVDSLTLSEALKGSGALEECGGLVYLARLASEVTTAANATYHARIVKRCAMRRRLIELNHALEAQAYEGSDQIDSILETAQEQLADLLGSTTDSGLKSYEDVLVRALARIEEVYRNKGKVSGIRSGFADLDRKTGGWQRGELIIVAGRPKMGKSALALQLADRAAMDGNPVAIFSLEMGDTELARRHLSMNSRVPNMSLKTGALTSEDWQYVCEAAGQLAKLPIYIDHTPGRTVPKIGSECRRLKREKGLSMVVIDYLQLMTPHGHATNREQEVAQMTRGMKNLARELEVPIVCLSQLSRRVEERPDKRPLPSDLRESGAIEQDADIVIFVYRPEYYNLSEFTNNIDGQEVTTQSAGMAEIIVALQRNGPTGTILARWDEALTSFSPYQIEKYREVPVDLYNPGND